MLSKLIIKFSHIFHVHLRKITRLASKQSVTHLKYSQKCIFTFLAMLVLHGVASCGYSLSQTEHMPGGYQRIFVTQASDTSSEVGPAGTLTRIMRQRIQTSRTVKLVSRTNAEIVLEPSIDNVADQTAVGPDPTKSYSVQKFTVVMAGTMRAIDADAKVVWQSPSISIAEDYLLSAQAAQTQAQRETALPVTESNRRRALERAAERLANELYSKLMENF